MDSRLLAVLSSYALTFSCAGHARAETDPSSSQERTSGIQLRLDAGLSWNWFTQISGQAAGNGAYSVLGGPTVSVGWRFSSGLVVSGGVSLHLGKLYDTSKYQLDQNDAEVVWPRVFAQVDDYPVRGVPVHFGVAAGFGSLIAGSFFENACDCHGVSGVYNEAGPGFVFAPHAGLDWSVGDSWTMGPLFRLWLGPTDRFGSGFVVAPELAFSAARF
jgi:hypothetical protein